MRHFLRWVGFIAAVLVTLGLGAMMVLFPALAAYACPPCYGLERMDRTTYVEAAMPAAERERLRAGIAAARDRVAAFYGGFEQQPTLLVCASEDCDRRLGGRGAKAVAYGRWLVRVSPRGANETILAHELSHIALHAMVGERALLEGRLPAWLDEGVAVIVADDRRFIGRDGEGRPLCLHEPGDDLPRHFTDWTARAGSDTTLYARAACAAARWMDANGGPAGVAAMARRLAGGESFP